MFKKIKSYLLKIKDLFRYLYLKFIIFNNRSKSVRLIYVVIFLWIIFGILGLKFGTDMTALAGYYTALSVFVGSYFWGEYKRPSSSTKLLEKGGNSSREITIYVTVILWICLGIYGVLQNGDFNSLTVYFASLSPFVGSFIIYKTNDGNKINNQSENIN